MKLISKTALSVCLLLGTTAAFGQNPPPGNEASPGPAADPAPAETRAAVPAKASKARPDGAYRYLEEDAQANFSPEYGYNKPYSVRSYASETGYINPNYRFPGRDDIDKGEKVDEAMQKLVVDGNKTMEEVLTMFYPERRDVFWQMDQVADPETGELHPLNMDVRGVMGRNTWIMWCGGNEWFWDWLASDGVGLLDYLYLLDSRQREYRFANGGLCNQPGMAKNSEPGPWGLYLDKLVEPLTDRNGKKLRANYDPLGDGTHQIVSDGVDPKIYGYPSGVIGFRLFPNPNFDNDAKAKWDPAAFYTDRNYRSNPDLERPLRVGMSCALCHVAAHPLNPPEDPAEPKWENLSAIIGNQYFRASAVLGTETHPTNFLYQFLSNQQPGTVDTSMTSTDWINNANAMNAVFEFQARIHRSLKNPAERQPEGALNLAVPFGEGKDPRRFPRVLMEGADSVGAWGALARVYLNIGLFGEQWNNVQNTIIGVPPRRPFSLDTLHTNSVNWNVNEAYRIHYSALYFNHRLVRDGSGKVSISADPNQVYNPDVTFVESSTQAMHLKNALIDGTRFEEHTGLVARHIEPGLVSRGRIVFTKNCMICHSSRQPEGYALDFSDDPPGADEWAMAKAGDGPLVLPLSHEHWDAFKKSPAYKGYLAKATPLANADADFFTHENFLSNEVRIPVSLVATNSQRAMAENALKGEVWNDFSSDGYKKLEPVGRIGYFDAIHGKDGASYQPRGKGRGFYRPATLVSVWATAPLLHNNALGHYIPDHKAAHRVSVAGRLEMFDDAIGKLLWKDRRGQTPSGEGGLRNAGGDSTWRGEDPGWVFRTTVSSYFRIEARQIRGVIERSVNHVGLSAGFLLFFVDHPWIFPVLFALVVGLLAWKFGRWSAYLAIAAGLILLLALFVGGLRHLLPFWGVLLALVILLAGLGTLTSLRYQARGTVEKGKGDGDGITRKDLFFANPITRWLAPAALWVLCLILFGALAFGKLYVNGNAGDMKLGPFPKGMPVSSFMNMNLDEPLKMVGAVRGLLKSFRAVEKIQSNPKLNETEKEQKALAAFNRYAGPGLLAASKCPDWELDRGHYFGESLTEEEKVQLIAFLKTL